MLSQQGKQKTHRSTREMSCETAVLCLALKLQNYSTVLVLFSGLNKGVTVFWHIQFVVVCDQNGVKLRVQMRDHL